MRVSTCIRKYLYKPFNKHKISENITIKKKSGEHIMINIFVMGTVLTSISIGLTYITYKLANSEEAKLLNEIQIKYPNNNNY